MPRKDGRKGRMAWFWREPAEHPIELCRQLALYPFRDNVLCIAARERIMADNGITMDDLYPAESEAEPEPEGLFT